MKAVAALVMGLCVMIPFQESSGVTNYMYGGNYLSWPTAWKPISSLNDPDDGKVESYDFVGDSSDPGAFWDADTNYFYFRMRVDDGAPGSNLWNGTVFLLIDQTNTGSVNSLEYAISWDYKEVQQQNHGLELQVSNVVGNSWGASRLSDIDGQQAQKIAPPDFTLSGTAFVRTIEGQSTLNFGTTTFIDMAAPWSSLTSSTSLRPGQTWRVQLGSTYNANDHNWINEDVGANHAPADIGLSWSDPIVVVVPEPGTISLLLIGLASLACGCVARRAK